MRVALCPIVRAHAQAARVSPGTTRSGRSLHRSRERLYDLNLQADVPVDSFLIVAPSPEVDLADEPRATRSSCTDGAAEQMEHVLLIVPRATDAGVTS